MGFPEALAANEAALAKLDSLKAVCREQCDDPEAAVSAIEPAARKRAVVAHHVITNGADSVAVALAAGRLQRLDDQHIAEVTRVAKAVSEGQDATEAAGADPKDVETLEKARSAHSSHAEALAAAYAEVGRTGRERVAAERA